MNRGEMRTLVRDAVLDEDATNPHFSDAKIDRRLNLDAKYVARMLDRIGLIHLTKATESFTTTQNTTAYALSSSTIRKVYGMWEVDSDGNRIRGSRQISEAEVPTCYASMKNGAWLYFITRNTSTKAQTINFPAYPGASHDFVVHFFTNLADIAAGSGNDTSEYTSIPDEYHELVVARTSMKLVGRDHSHYQRIVDEYAGLEQELIIDAQQGASPREIAQEW